MATRPELTLGTNPPGVTGAPTDLAGVLLGIRAFGFARQPAQKLLFQGFELSL